MTQEEPELDEAERQLWCQAWRLLVAHGDDTGRVIDAEIARALSQSDPADVAYWRRIALAAEELAQ
jgi:hypothetical protein